MAEGTEPPSELVGNSGAATPTLTWLARVVFDRVGAPQVLDLAFQQETQALLEGHAPAFAVSPGDVELSFGVKADSIVTALRESTTVLRALESAIALRPEAIKRFDLAERDVPSDGLMGLSEVAEALGISPGEVLQLSKNEDFPKPIFRLRATPAGPADAIPRQDRPPRRPKRT